MDELTFWTIIEAGGPYDLDQKGRHLASVRRQLKASSPNDVFFFHRILFQKVVDAHTWDFWAAARLINGGSSEEGFVYFRTWIISQGQLTYAKATENPDSLIEIVDPHRHDYEFQSLYQLPSKVFFTLTGDNEPRLGLNWPVGLQGEEWDVHNVSEVHRRLPRLAAIYHSVIGPARDRLNM
jgi:hypothetical protein